MMRLLEGFARLWLAVLLLAAHSAALAHKPSDSYLTLSAAFSKPEASQLAGGLTLTARWDIALRDLDYVLQLDRDGNGELTWGETRQREADINRLATNSLQIKGDNLSIMATRYAKGELAQVVQ